MKWLFLVCIYLISSSCISSNSTNLLPAAVKKTEIVGHIQNVALWESSGLVNSRKQSHILWSHNDSGDMPLLYAVSTRGEHLGSIRLSNAVNRDWEDIANYHYNGMDYLLIADIGDNDAQHRFYRVLIVKEPSIDELSADRVLAVDVVRTIRFQYEDGPHDSEALAVDPNNGDIFLLSKRKKPASLYRLTWEMDDRQIHIAKKIVSLKGLPTTRNIFTPFRHQPTAMDISQDGKKMVVLTYGNAYLYTRKGQNWKNTLLGTPKLLRIPRLKQAESICFSAHEPAIYIGSERKRAPIVKIHY